MSALLRLAAPVSQKCSNYGKHKDVMEEFLIRDIRPNNYGQSQSVTVGLAISLYDGPYDQ